MNKDNNIKTQIFLYTSLFILFSIYLIVLSNAVANYKFFSGQTFRLNNILVAISGFNNPKQITTYLIFELCNFIIFAFIIYTKLIQPKGFTSNEIQITPDIKIPAPAGQGQFGSAWFMEDKTKDKVFKSNIIDINNEKIKYLLETGDSDIKENIDKLNKGISIADIETLIKEKNEEMLHKKESEENEKLYQEMFLNENNEDDVNDEDNNYIDLIINNEIVDLEDFNEIEEGNNDIDEYLVNQYVENIKNKNETELKNEKPYNPNEDENKIFKKGGLITGVYKQGENEKILYIDSDTHSVDLGATRSGKSRCLVLQSVGNLALAGESIVVTDPKGELYAYTSKFMEKLGYEIVCLDFKNANYSSHYNLLQPIINAKNDKTEEHPNGDIELMVKYAEELANMMIKETKGENPMWTENAKTMLTGAILSLTLLQDDEDIMNVSNVYRFINNGEGKDICQTKDNLGLLIKALQLYAPESPIINAMLGVINTPSETRGGFSTNASSATRLFTQPSIWQITHKSNVDITKMGERKQILYFILPDQDKSYYKIVSIIVKQMYNELVKISDKYGGRLPIRVNFILDEFGNFAPMPDLDAMLTVAGGRGMRFNMFIQGFPQITQRYDKETTEIVKSNCETWIYLKANDTATLDEISKKLGSYTIYSNSESRNINSGSITSSSSSQSLQKRNLLLPEEVKAINRPYMLVMYGNNRPAVNEAPDISKLLFNKFYGLGDEKHNNNLRMIRDRQRKITKSKEQEKYWNIFQELKQICNDKIDPYSDIQGRVYDKPRNISEDEYISVIADYLKEKEEMKE